LIRIKTSEMRELHPAAGVPAAHLTGLSLKVDFAGVELTGAGEAREQSRGSKGELSHSYRPSRGKQTDPSTAV
jgi:hypothetical protein